MRTLSSLAFCSLLLLSGCGQKGPLYLPDEKPTAVPPASDTTGQTTTEDEESSTKRRAPASPN